MKASEFLKTLPERPTREREALILQAVRNGHALPPRWAKIHSYAGTSEAVIEVAEDALAIGEPDDWVRVTVNHTTAQEIADHLGCALPTTRIANLAYAQAAVRLSPCFQKPDAQMAFTSRMVQHHRKIEEKRAGRPGLVSNVGKDWVLTNRLAGNPNHAANYGWFDTGAPNKKLWQTLGLAHDRWHVDYSQTVRLVNRTLTVDGTVVQLDDVLRSGELAALVSDEGPLRIVRHPGVGVGGTRGLGALLDAPAFPPESAVLPFIPFVGARNYTRASGRATDLIVIHTMEAVEKGSTAEAVATWFAGTHAPRASAHYCVDNNSIVQCVHEEDVGWHAPGANQNGIGIEHAGFASQTSAQWDDAYSVAMLDLSARLVADICRRRSIPVAFVNEAGLQSGARGITTHAAVTRAFRRSSHTDPGGKFPMDAFLAKVRGYAACAPSDDGARFEAPKDDGGPEAAV